MRPFAIAGLFAVSVLAGACTSAPAAQVPQPVPTTVTAEPVTVTATTTETVPTTVTSVVTRNQGRTQAPPGPRPRTARPAAA